MVKKGIAFLLILILAFPCAAYGAEAKAVSTTISNNSSYSSGESTEADFSELLGSDNGIEIYGKNNLTYNTPADGMMEVVMLVKNTNSYAVEMAHGSDYDINEDNFSGSITKYCKDFTAITHPNGSDYVIDANSELTYIIDISLPNFNNQDKSVDCDMIFSYDFIFNNSNNRSKAGEINIALNADIHYIGRNVRSSASKRTATIKGVVVDTNSKPISGVEIEVSNAIDEGMDPVVTDANGKFSLKVTAYKSRNTKMWHESLLTFKRSGYNDQTICVYPKTNQTNNVKLVMTKSSAKRSYTNTAKLDLGIQAYSYDTDSSKSVIAFTPFHSGWNYSNIKDKLNITYTDFDGNVLFKYKLNAETPWVCVSDDGEYVVTAQAVSGGNEQSTDIVVLDKSGKELYKGTPDNKDIHSRCAQLSHDNSYLAVGSDDGDFWLVDWQKNKVLWTAKTHGQVRNVVFDEDDDTILVSSGDGYIYGYNTNGHQLFKTYVGSWATDMELAGNSLVYTLKTSWGSVGCVNISTGKIIWTYESLARGSGLAVSKDKKYVWWGNDVASSYSAAGNIVLDMKTGKIAYVLKPGAGQQAMYSGNGKYLVVKTATELQVYETTNYSCVWEKTIVSGYGENTASINQTVAVNADASKIVAAFNNDTSGRFYGQAYYFSLKGSKTKITESMVSDISDQTYTGKARKPAVNVDGLTKGKDYTVSYSNNVNVGTAKAKITGKGSYSGTVTKTFRINPKGTSIKTLTSGENDLTAKWTKQTAKMSKSRISGYQLQYDTSPEFDSTDNIATISGYAKTSKKVAGLEAGSEYYVRVRTYKKVSGKTYYSKWSAAKSVNVGCTGDE